jgi:hypothetical protein
VHDITEMVVFFNIIKLLSSPLNKNVNNNNLYIVRGRLYKLNKDIDFLYSY